MGDLGVLTKSVVGEIREFLELYTITLSLCGDDVCIKEKNMSFDLEEMYSIRYEVKDELGIRGFLVVIFNKDDYLLYDVSFQDINYIEREVFRDISDVKLFLKERLL